MADLFRIEDNVLVSYLGEDGDVVIPEGITTIGPNSFRDKSISNVTLSEGVEKIDCNAFWGCEKLLHINFPESLQSIESYAFQGCALLEEVHIPRNTAIKSNNFKDCSNLQIITIDENHPHFMAIDNIIYDKSDKKIFYVPRGLKGDVNVIDGTPFIDHHDFENCTKITNVTLPQSISRIGCSAFEALPH